MRRPKPLPAPVTNTRFPLNLSISASIAELSARFSFDAKRNILAQGASLKVDIATHLAKIALLLATNSGLVDNRISIMNEEDKYG